MLDNRHRQMRRDEEVRFQTVKQFPNTRLTYNQVTPFNPWTLQGPKMLTYCRREIAKLAAVSLVAVLSYSEMTLQSPSPTKAPVCIEYCQGGN